MLLTWTHKLGLLRFGRQLQTINDLGVNIADPEAWVFWWFRFYHIICRHFALVCY